MLERRTLSPRDCSPTQPSTESNQQPIKPSYHASVFDSVYCLMPNFLLQKFELDCLVYVYSRHVGDVGTQAFSYGENASKFLPLALSSPGPKVVTNDLDSRECPSVSGENWRE